MCNPPDLSEPMNEWDMKRSSWCDAESGRYAMYLQRCCVCGEQGVFVASKGGCKLWSNELETSAPGLFHHQSIISNRLVPATPSVENMYNELKGHSVGLKVTEPQEPQGRLIRSQAHGRPYHLQL